MSEALDKINYLITQNKVQAAFLEVMQIEERWKEAKITGVDPTGECPLEYFELYVRSLKNYYRNLCDTHGVAPLIEVQVD